MQISLILILAVAVLLVATGVYLRLRWRRLTRKLAESEEQADDLARLLALEHDTTYQMACEMHGKAAVDRVIKESHDRGVS